MSLLAWLWGIGLVGAVAVVFVAKPRLPPEPFFTDLVFMLVGVGGIVVAMGVLGHDIVYLPSDIRSQPWFAPLESSIMVLIGLFAFEVGAVRLLLHLRQRGRR
jgi:hypothetical protein